MLEKLVLTGRRMNPELEQLVINLGRAGVVGERLARAGVQVRSLELRRSLRLLGRLRTLVRALRAADGALVVQTWLWHADLLGGVCARLAGNRRVVWNLRNSMPRHAATKASSRLVARACAWLSRSVPARIICNSRAALEAHVAVGYCERKCVVIPNGFDLRLFTSSADARTELRARWQVAPAEHLVGMVARVDPMKDHATFIRAAAQVVQQAPQTRFVLVGAGVAADPAIKLLLTQTGLSERFILEERRADVQQVMSALDVFCLASLSEGFPNVLGEAMACALPAVGTDVGDVRDILQDERLVAPVGDPQRLAACITHVLQLSPEARRALGLAQQQSIATRFDIEQVWQQYRALYASL